MICFNILFILISLNKLVFFGNEMIKLGNESEYEIAQYYKNQVPNYILEEFIWRRQRNHNITMDILDLQYQYLQQNQVPLFDYICITQVTYQHL